MIDGSVAYRRSAHDATARLFYGHQAGRATIRLSDPDRFLRIIAVLCWPIKFFPMVLVPAVLLAGLTMFKHWNDVRDNIQVLFGELSFVIHLLLGLFIVNLVARLSMGAAISAFGGAVREFGFFFFLGIIPRFYVDRSAIPLLDRNGQLWAYGAPLMARLGFFAFGILVWAIYRSSGTSLATLALLISQVGLWAFLYAIVPVLPGDGYFWLATYLHQPLLRQKAFVALNAKLRGRPLPRAIRHGERDPRIGRVSVRHFNRGGPAANRKASGGRRRHLPRALRERRNMVHRPEGDAGGSQTEPKGCPPTAGADDHPSGCPVEVDAHARAGDEAVDYLGLRWRCAGHHRVSPVFVQPGWTVRGTANPPHQGNRANRR